MTILQCHSFLLLLTVVIFTLLLKYIKFISSVSYCIHYQFSIIRLSQNLVKRFSFISMSNVYTVKSSNSFLNIIKSIKPSPYLHMVSYDVCSLFTHVHVQGTIQCLTVRSKDLYYTDYEINPIIEFFSICLK